MQALQICILRHTFVILLLASGDGDTIMRFCPSFQIVELMNYGVSPQDACERAVKNITSKCGKETEVALIALDVKVCNFLYK